MAIIDSLKLYLVLTRSDSDTSYELRMRAREIIGEFQTNETRSACETR
jgi:hypothetical protein